MVSPSINSSSSTGSSGLRYLLGISKVNSLILVNSFSLAPQVKSLPGIRSKYRISLLNLKIVLVSVISSFSNGTVINLFPLSSKVVNSSLHSKISNFGITLLSESYTPSCLKIGSISIYFKLAIPEDMSTLISKSFINNSSMDMVSLDKTNSLGSRSFIETSLMAS